MYGCNLKLLSMSVSALGLAIYTTGASAADVSEASAYEEIIVTANKREQRLVDVPMAIQSISGNELEERGIDTIEDLGFAVPGVTMRADGPGSYQVFIRGGVNTYGGGAMTSIYQDEVPMTLTGYSILPTRAMDLKRIEVLKGPQGTLYGQGAVAGAVRYITNDPDLEEVEGRMEAELLSVAGGDVGMRLMGVYSIPIVEDKLAIRIAAELKDGGGWQDQPEAGIADGNGEELLNLRAKVLWKPSDNLEVMGTYANYRAEYRLGQGHEQPDRTVFVAIDPSFELDPKIWEYELFNLQVTYDLDFAELISSTSYADSLHRNASAYRGGEQTRYDGSLEGYSNGRHLPADQFSQELRLTSAGDSPFSWTLGAFYRDMKRTTTRSVVTLFNGNLSNSDRFEEQASKSYAVFGDIAYQITDKLNMGVGVRYFEDDATLSTTADNSNLQEDTFDSVDPRFYLSYALNDDMTIYANVAKGFRSGGFNRAGNPPFEPESLWSYELGFKGSMLDGDVFVDVAAYYTEYNDMLRRGLVNVPGYGLLTITSNIGKAEIKGFEAGLSWNVTESLTLSGSLSVIDAEITEVNAVDNATNNAGDMLDYVPDLSYTLSAKYDFMWSRSNPGYFRLDYSYRDKMPYTDRTSFPEENVPQWSDAIGLLDTAIGATVKDRFSVEVFAENLLNKNKYIDPYHAWNNANRTRPRTVGVKLGIGF